MGFNTGYLKKIIEGVKKSIANGDEVTCTQLNEIVSVPRSGYPAVNEFRPTGRKSIIIRINGGDKKQELDAFTSRIFGPGGEAERKNDALVKPLLEKINSAIEKVATEGNYDFIFNSAGLAYAKKDYDITDKVLKALEEE